MQCDLPINENSERVQYSTIFWIIVSQLELYFICEAFWFLTTRAYFALSLLNVISELLEEGKQDNLHILGCQTLTKFVYNQVSLFLVYYYLIRLKRKSCQLLKIQVLNCSIGSVHLIGSYSIVCNCNLILCHILLIALLICMCCR